MQSRGGPERERERARTWRWRQLSRGGREGCGDAESGRECGRQGPESLRPAWGAWLSPRGRSWVAGGSQPFACSRDRSLRSHEQVSVPPVCSRQEARGGGGGPHAGSASRERPWPAWHVLLSHLRDRRNARTGADFKPSRGAQSGTRLSPSPGVRAPSSGAGRGLRVPACSACIHARRPRVWVSRKKPHLLPLPAQAVCGTVVWGRPARRLRGASCGFAWANPTLQSAAPRLTPALPAVALGGV